MVKPIVVAVDGSESAAVAVSWAADDACRRGLPLRVVHVCEKFSLLPDEVVERQRDHGETVVAAAAERARERAPGLRITTEPTTGNVVEELIAEAGDADCVVLGSRGLGGFTGLLVGSAGLGVAGHAPGPVVIVRGSAEAAHGEVVAGFDGSPASEAALEYAFQQARARKARLRVMYAWRMPVTGPYAFGMADTIRSIEQGEVEQARERLAPWPGKYPDVPVVEDVVCGHPAYMLSRASQSADLVVVGSRGLGGFASAVLGSVSHAVLHHAACPVAVVRPRPAGQE
ncbi:universal stress protein [Nonomuraea sediminis]|uniref:universal stress protein n=1 Tax=Nonomuraea sediminis TaxID=2835864 RepID=UPI001BDD29AA|nr:universal stress protein [Nonomuraea sediminis]